MMFTMGAVKTSPSAQSLGFFDPPAGARAGVELRVSDAGGVQWLEAKGNPLSQLDAVIDWPACALHADREGFRPLLEQALAKPPAKQRQKDVDARWTEKNAEVHSACACSHADRYGYKNHVKADAQSKLIERYAVTDASVHDSQMLSPS